MFQENGMSLQKKKGEWNEDADALAKDGVFSMVLKVIKTQVDSNSTYRVESPPSRVQLNPIRKMPKLILSPLFSCYEKMLDSLGSFCTDFER